MPVEVRSSRRQPVPTSRAFYPPADGRNDQSAPTVLGDLRFRALFTDADWARLPPEVRRRFSRRLAGGQTVVYVGHVTEAYINRAGSVLVQLARLVGGPFPLSRDVNLPSVVTVTEDTKRGGQIWTRLYARRNHMPQVIHSSKHFAGPTGLEEHVGFGIGMTLRVSSTEQALIFTSASYFVQYGSFRLSLPRRLQPGHLTVSHEAIDATHFAFTLDLVHPWFGMLLHQRAIFTDMASSGGNAIIPLAITNN